MTMQIVFQASYLVFFTRSNSHFSNFSRSTSCFLLKATDSMDYTYSCGISGSRQVGATGDEHISN